MILYLTIDVGVTSGICLTSRCLTVVICITIWMTRFTQNQVFQHNSRNYKWICSISHVIFPQAWILCAVELAESNAPFCSFVCVNRLHCISEKGEALTSLTERTDVTWWCYENALLYVRWRKQRHLSSVQLLLWRRTATFYELRLLTFFAIKLMGLFLNGYEYIVCVW
jgi:hypothetical protein